MNKKNKQKQKLSSFDAHFKLSDEFVDEIILIRKFYVHGAEVKTKLTEAMQRKENILKHVRSLEILFKIHLLLEIDLTEDNLIEMIRKKPWQWISRD